MPTTGLLSGYKVALYLDKGGVLTQLGCAQSVSLTVNKEVPEATCKDSNKWKDFVTDGQLSYTVSFSGLEKLGNPYDAITDGFGAITSDLPISFQFRLNDDEIQVGDFVFAGSVIMSSLAFETGTTDPMGYSGELQGTGALTLSQYTV